jgi:hypothetical protein
MSRANTWTNSDGLIVGFGQHSSDNHVPGEVRPAGVVKTAVVEIVGVDLVDTFAATDVPPQALTIRRGSKIISAALMVTEAFTSGGAATLDLGLWGKSAAVVDDADGIDVDIALTAIDAVGDIVVCDGALVNGVIAVGATANSDCVIAPSYETAVFTAGKASLTVQYIEPQFDDSVAA